MGNLMSRRHHFSKKNDARNGRPPRPLSFPPFLPLSSFFTSLSYFSRLEARQRILYCTVFGLSFAGSLAVLFSATSSSPSKQLMRLCGYQKKSSEPGLGTPSVRADSDAFLHTFLIGGKATQDIPIRTQLRAGAPGFLGALPLFSSGRDRISRCPNRKGIVLH